MQKELKDVFHQVEMPEQCVLDIEKAIEEKMEREHAGQKIFFCV